MKLLEILGAIAFICFYTPTSSADIYSWVDENGTTHFTNYSPPPAARLVLKDIPISQRMPPDKERIQEDRLGERPEISQDLEETKVQIKKKNEQASEEASYSSGSDYPDASGSDKSENSYVSDYPPGFYRYPPEVHRLKHHPNYHYKYHLDKPYAKKRDSAFLRKRHNNKPTIWDRKPRSHKKRVFGWQPPKAKARPSAHYFAFGGGHYRGTTVPAKGRFGGGRAGR